MLPPDEYVVFEDVDGLRCYWQGPGTRVWRAGDAGRRSAARFPDRHVAREAIASSRAQRKRLLRIGYEWLPPTVQQLDLNLFEEGAR